MTTGVCFPNGQAPPAPGALTDEQVRHQVWDVLVGLYPQGRVIERRADQRYPYSHLLYLTPVGDDGITPVGESVSVVGKTLSERGLGFFYQQAISQKRMIASLETSDLHWAGFLMNITWCRFTQYGWYESGGRFLQAVPSPITRPVR